MSAAMSLLVNRMLGLQLGNTRYGTNHDIYDKRLTLSNPWPPFTFTPHVLYFYYMRFNSDGKIHITHQLYTDGPDPSRPVPNAPIPHDRVPDIIKTLALRARPTGGGVFPYADLNNLVWDHKSYVAFFVDEKDWRLHRRSDGKAAVAFNVNASGGPNLSFFDAKDELFEMPITGSADTDFRSAIYFVNHMKTNAEGDDLPDEDQLFQFDMYFDVTFSGSPDLKTTVIIDPGGTNNGPPIDP